MHGIFPIYKPSGITSHDVINILRKKTGEKTIGHAGTLDPLARGVLVVGVGREATRKLADIVKGEKEYIAVVRLGAESATDDAEGPFRKLPISNTQFPTKLAIDTVIKSFVGKIMQIPPIYSALKIKGKPAYHYARTRKEVELKPREVEIKEIELLNYEYPDVKLRVVTGPGVYIRALARDLGKALRTGAYLADLERTRVGDYTKEDSIKIAN